MTSARSVPTRSIGWVLLIVVVLLVSMARAPANGPSAQPSRAAPEAAATSPVAAVARAPGPDLHIIIPHPTWVNVTNSSPGRSPPLTYGASTAYDPLDHETVSFGGWLESQDTFSNQTWVFANGSWTNETDPYAAPPARDYAAMDFDANMGGLLLFGGAGDNGYLNDTWLFSDGSWTNLTPDYGIAPPAEYGAAMAFDPDAPENGSVLFGGYSPYTTSGYLNSTWIWQGGAGWVPLTSSSIAPPQLFAPAMAYDASDGYIVLFGGLQSSIEDSDQTWELYSGEWWQVNPSTSPPARSYSSLVYVPSLSGVLMFGGYSYETGESLGDSWSFSDGAWTHLAPSASPGGRDSAQLALDGTGTTAIIVAGSNSTDGFAYNDTWAYEFAPYATLTTPATIAEVGETVTYEVALADGTAPYQSTVDFGDGSIATVSGAGPDLFVNHTFSNVGTYTAWVNVTDAVGATTSATSAPISVSARPSVSPHESATQVDVGFADTFTSTVAGGTPAYSYNWSFGDGAFATTGNASHSYGAAGAYTLNLTLTDGLGATALGSLTVTVVADPTLAVAATTTHPAVGASASFFANITGGTGPYSYAWNFGDGSGAATVPAPSHSFGKSGTYSVQVWVNDSDGRSTHQSMSVAVGGGSSSTSSTSGTPLWFWAGIGALVAALAIGAVLLVRRGKG